MPRTETLEDLLADVIDSDGLTALARKAGIRPWTLLRLRNGDGTRTHAGTVLALARALRLPQDRVRAAIEAQRAAKE